MLLVKPLTEITSLLAFKKNRRKSELILIGLDAKSVKHLLVDVTTHIVKIVIKSSFRIVAKGNR